MFSPQYFLFLKLSFALKILSKKDVNCHQVDCTSSWLQYVWNHNPNQSLVERNNKAGVFYVTGRIFK